MPEPTPISSKTRVAKLILALIVLLGFSPMAMADANAALGTVLLIFYLPLVLAAPLALAAFGLALSPGKRRVAVWVSWVALVAGVFAVVVCLLFAGSGPGDSRSKLGWLAIFSMPAYLSLIALNLGMRGSAPPSPASRAAMVFLLIAPVAALATYGVNTSRLQTLRAEHQIQLSTGPSSYQGISLWDWVVRYIPYPYESYETHHQAMRHTLYGPYEWPAYRPEPPEKKADGEKAKDAIRQIGDKALPLFLAWFDEQGDPRAFGALGPDAAARAIPELTRRINSPPSSEEVKALSSRYDDQPAYSVFSKFPRQRAMLALSNMGQNAAPAMMEVISNPALAGLPCVAQCIRNMGTNARPLVPALVKNLQHSDYQVAGAAAYALGSLRYDPDLVVPALVSNLDDPRPQVRRSAADALASYGELACPGAAPALIHALDDRTPAIAGAAMAALGRMTCEPDVVLPALAKCLQHPDSTLGYEALKSLQALGDPALPVLRDAVSQANAEIRGRAKDALEKMAFKIFVRSSRYGRNCGAPEGNTTDHLASSCNGKGRCSYVLDEHYLGDPAPGCQKDYEAEWGCRDPAGVSSGAIYTAAVRVELDAAPEPGPSRVRRDVPLGTIQLVCY